MNMDTYKVQMAEKNALKAEDEYERRQYAKPHFGPEDILPNEAANIQSKKKEFMRTHL